MIFLWKFVFILLEIHIRHSIKMIHTSILLLANWNDITESVVNNVDTRTILI